MADSLRGRVRRGALWSTSAALFGTVMTFGISLVLARLLEPADFGLAAMVSFFLGIAGALGGTSFGTALVYHRDTDARELDTVFWTTMLMALAWMLALFAGAPLLASFYGEPSLTSLIRVWCVVLLLQNLCIIPTVELQRGMQIDMLARIRAASAVVHGTVSVASAYAGAGVWTFVYAQIVQLVFLFVLQASLSRYRPGLSLGGGKSAEIRRFAVMHAASDVLGALTLSWDGLIVGRLLGAAPLGLYRRARTLPDQVLAVIMQVAGDLLFPAFAFAQDDLPRVRSLVLRAISLAAGLATPLLFGLGALSHEAVFVLYGEKWADTAPLLQITVGGLWLATIGAPLGALFVARGRTDLRLKLAFATTVLSAAAFLIGAWMADIRAIAWAYTLVMLVHLILRCALAGPLVEVRARDIAARAVGPVGCGLGMLAAVYGLRAVLHGSSPFAVLAITIPAGAVVYLGLAWLARLEAIEVLRSLFRRQNE